MTQGTFELTFEIYMLKLTAEALNLTACALKLNPDPINA